MIMKWFRLYQIPQLTFEFPIFAEAFEFTSLNWYCHLKQINNLVENLSLKEYSCIMKLRSCLLKTGLSSFVLTFVFSVSYGQALPAETVKKGFTFDTNTYLVIIAVLLLLPIRVMSKTFIEAAKHFYSQKLKSGNLKLIIPFGLLLSASSLFAEETSTSTSIERTVNPMTILLLCVIFIEICLLIFFAQKTNGYLRKTG